MELGYRTAQELKHFQSHFPSDEAAKLYKSIPQLEKWLLVTLKEEDDSLGWLCDYLLSIIPPRHYAWIDNTLVFFPKENSEFRLYNFILIRKGTTLVGQGQIPTFSIDIPSFSLLNYFRC